MTLRSDIRRGLGVLRRWLVAAAERRRTVAGRAAYRAPQFETIPVESGASPPRAFAVMWRAFRLASLRLRAKALTRAEDWECAAQAFERVLRLDSGDHRAWFGLGVACEAGGPFGCVIDQRVGLIEGHRGDPESAVRAYDRAIALAPLAPYHLRRGVALASMKRFDEAIDSIDRAIEQGPDSADSWFQRGRAVAARGAHRGAFLQDELATMHSSWAKALAIEPSHQSARYHLVRSLVSGAQWAAAATTALAPVGADDPGPDELAPVWKEDGDVDTASSVTAVRVHLDSAERRDPTTRDWWYVLHARLHALGEFEIAYEIKSSLAEQVAADSDRPLWRLGVTGFLDVARALSYLGDDERAIRHVRGASWRWLPRHEAAAFSKLLADLELRRGDPEPLHRVLDLHRLAETESAERHFVELVTDRRVAIVGPGISTAPNGVEIDSFDTVIRTKFRDRLPAESSAAAGARTDVSYYSDSNSRLLRDDIRQAISSGSLKMAVFRPTSYDPGVRMIHRRGDLRYMPSQDSSPFEATHFGVQRIVYDILRYRPAEVKLFNIDFFLSTDAYFDGYTAEARDVFDAAGLQLVRTSAAHDLVLDFEFVQRLVGHGLIAVDDQIAGLLEMSPGQYVAAMQRSRSGPPRF